MKLRRITEEDRKREKIGSAVDWEVELDHMGGAIGKRTGSFYLSDGLLLELHDLTDASATVLRDLVADALWAKLDAIVVDLYASSLTEEDLAYLLAIRSSEKNVAEIPEWDGRPATEAARSWVAWGEMRGAAQGLAVALAFLTNPRRPDIEWVREEAQRRYESAG